MRASSAAGSDESSRFLGRTILDEERADGARVFDMRDNEPRSEGFEGPQQTTQPTAFGLFGT
jgi:hypothetical protein